MSSIVPPAEESVPSSQGGPASVTEIDPPSVRSSEALIPHPNTDAEVPFSSSSAEILEAPLTPEVYASGALPAGTRLGYFVIRSFIGGGGMGRVYLATDTALDRKVALKVLPRQRANDQGTVARFTNEAKSAARLNHEHIAQVYFSGEESGIPFIVFEYVEGTNIRTLVEENGLFSVPQAITYLIQIAHALAHAAEHGVIHRDVKPSNVLITASGRAKLIDMGLARLLDPSESKDDLTASGVTLGTFDYISPEQARDPRAADIRSDIYSLGCTLFFMLTGQPPFPEGTVLQKLLQHQGDVPPDVRTFQPHIPSEVALLIQKMMAKDPRQRFQTPSHLIESLTQVAELLGLRPSEPGKLDWAMGAPGRKSVFEKHVPWFAAVSALLLLFFGLHFFWNQAAQMPVPDIPIIDTPESTIVRQPSERPPPDFSENGRQVSALSSQVEQILWSPQSPEQLDAAVHRRRLQPNTETIDAQWSNGARVGIVYAAAPISSVWPPDTTTELSEALPFSRIQELSVSMVETGLTRWTVDPSGATPNSHLSLSAALAEAGKRATIELKWNGPLGIDPISLIGRDLKITASPGHVPMLSFRPTDALFFPQHSRSMFALNDSSLEFQDVDVVMDIDRDVLASRWTLFEFFGPGKLTFVRCCLTIRNARTDFSAHHQEVAFFRTSPQQSGFEALTVDDPPVPFATEASIGPQAADIQICLSDSLFRGEATALLCALPQNVDLRLEHSFVALAQTFVQTEGIKQTAKQGNLVRVFLDHAFVYSRHSLAKQNRTAVAEPIRLEFDVQSSVVRLDQTPLFESWGTVFPDEDESPFHWKGRGNCFHSISLGWKLRAPNPFSDLETAGEMTFAEWKDRVNASPSIDNPSLPEIRKPTHQLRPADLFPESFTESLNVGPNRHRTLRDWSILE